LWTAGNFTVDGVKKEVLARLQGDDWIVEYTGKQVRDVSFRPDGRVVAIVTLSGDYLLSQSSTGWTEGRIGNWLNGGFAYCVSAIDNDRIVVGTRLALGNGKDFPGVRILDHETWKEAGSVLAGSDNILDVRSDGVAVAGTDAGVVAMWDGVEWRQLGEAANGAITALKVCDDGQVFAGGRFSKVGSVAAQYIARWDGAEWKPMGSGLGNAPLSTPVQSLTMLHDKRLLVCGQFQVAGGVAAKNIAVWKDNSWSVLGTSPATKAAYGAIESLTGNILIGFEGSAKGTASWNGTFWSTIQSGSYYPSLMEYDRDGVLRAILKTEFQVYSQPYVYYAGGGWNGQYTFTHQQSEYASASGMCLLPDNSAIVAGYFGIVYGSNMTLNNVGSIVRIDNAGASLVLPPPVFGEIRSFGPAMFSQKANEMMIVGGPVYAMNGRHLGINRWSPMPKPWIARPPVATVSIAQTSATLFAMPATGYSIVSYRWQRDSISGTFEDVLNGPGGAAPGGDGGGVVSGASGQLPSPTDGTPATLTITNIQQSDAGLYRVTFWNSCGEATSIAVEIKVKAHITDINADGQVDDADFLLFSTQYDLMLCTDPLMPDACSADFNHDGFVDDADFAIFIPAYTTMLFK